jgi:hypothetical protein
VKNCHLVKISTVMIADSFSIGEITQMVPMLKYLAKVVTQSHDQARLLMCDDEATLSSGIMFASRAIKMNFGLCSLVVATVSSCIHNKVDLDFLCNPFI